MTTQDDTLKPLPNGREFIDEEALNRWRTVEGGSRAFSANNNTVRRLVATIDHYRTASGVTALAQEVERLKEAAERGLEWVIEAANERKTKDGVFDNAMKDIRFIEQALATSGTGGSNAAS